MTPPQRSAVCSRTWQSKLRCGNRERLKRQGAAQIRQYINRAAADEGHLLILDRTEDRGWEDRVFREDLAGLPPVSAWGMRHPCLALSGLAVGAHTGSRYP